MVELTRFEDAAHARVASRTLLAAGLHPEVARDGDHQVIRIDAAELDQACALLDLDRDAAGDTSEPTSVIEDVEEVDEVDDIDEVEAPEPEHEPEPEPEPETEPVESIFGAGLTAPTPTPTADAAQESASADDHAHLPPPPGRSGAAEGTVEPVREKIRRPDIDAEGYAVIALVATQDAASTQAAQLLEAGIGVDIVAADEAGYGASVPDPAAPSPSRVVRVLPSDTDRALELLGLSGVDPPRRTRLVEGTEATTIDGEEVQGYFGGRLRVTRRQLIVMIVVYVAALILIPLFFFWGTQELLDPNIPDPVPTLPGGTTPGVD